jgi:phosphoribosylamine--glycine ligase
MRILVVGSGGREHAILWALRKTASYPVDLYCAPGNAGIAQIAQCISIVPTDISSLAQFAGAEAIDLTFVGPEGSLAAGIVDEFARRGLLIAGPTGLATRLEASKAFAKDFMARHEIPTARYQTVDSVSQALDLLRSGAFGAKDSRVVVKADGLAAGKGVIVANSRSEAERAVAGLMSGALVGAEAARQVVIEQVLEGREVSLLLFSDGRDYALMPAARDHKRIGEGDTGPNTGGMGAITDASIVSSEVLERIVREIVEPTLEGACAEGFPFRGVLFVGLMLTSDGPQVLEYNVRFGDPETQAILVRLETDLAQLFEAIARGTLSSTHIAWNNRSSACVILASRGYPGKYETGARIEGLDRPTADSQVEVFHAGTSRSQNGDWLTAGGRVLGVTATGASLDQALGRCYNRVDEIRWEGMEYRGDIGRFGIPSPTSAEHA